MQSLGMRRYEGGLGRPLFSFISGLRFDCYALLLRIDCRLIIINFPPMRDTSSFAGKDSFRSKYR